MRYISFFVLMSVVALCFCAAQTQKGKDYVLEETVRNLVRQINENPDLLHADWTTAVLKLIRIGRPALKYGALDLLLSDDELTRLRSWRVVEGVTMAEMGFVLGQGWPKGENAQIRDEKWRQLWRSNGSYDADAPKEAREAAYQKWVSWLHKTEADKQFNPQRE
jgi:hypothetical protein